MQPTLWINLCIEKVSFYLPVGKVYFEYDFCYDITSEDNSIKETLSFNRLIEYSINPLTINLINNTGLVPL